MFSKDLHDEDWSPFHDITVVDDESDSLQESYEYSLKAINPLGMSDYKTVKIYEYTQGCFKSLDELRDFMARNLPVECNVEDIGAVEIGYIEPGHGSKGKKVWLCNDSDLKAMYNAHNKKKVINLWCYTEKKCSRGKKRSRSPGDEKASSSKYESHSTKRLALVDDIYEKLQDKHKGKYSPEQLRTWAHLLQMGKHESYEEPPDKPFFRGKKSSALSAVNTPTQPVSISPGKKVNMRTELINQLEKWYQLLEMGAISQTQYAELKDTILLDIKEL